MEFEEILEKTECVDKRELLAILGSQLYYCSENSKKTNIIDKENLGRINVVNNILTSIFKMTYKEVGVHLSSYGLNVEMIEK